MNQESTNLHRQAVRAHRVAAKAWDDVIEYRDANIAGDVDAADVEATVETAEAATGMAQAASDQTDAAAALRIAFQPGQDQTYGPEQMAEIHRAVAQVHRTMCDIYYARIKETK